MIKQLMWVGAGGFVGAILRYLISGWGNAILQNNFPVGTFIVNIVGCLVLGILYGISTPLLNYPNLRLFLATGLLGALTTFSTFSLETITLLQGGDLLKAGTNVVLSI
ncbi:MAG: fluoride efflux transporter CrcB, partial [Calditrichota bacterium]